MKLAEAYVEVKTNQAKFGKELKTMESSVKRSTDRMKKNFDRIGRGVSEISRTARYAFLGMAAAIAGVVYAAAKFEKQMANVSTMLSRKSMPIMEKYKDMIGKMSVAFGESTETLSKGLYDILSASIAPSKALGVLAVSAKAAAAGMTDTGVAADTITTIINSYGYAAEDASMISDKLFTIISKGKTTFAELGPNIGKVAATAAMAKISFDELGATIATVTRAGIRTEMAMTAINGILKVFIKPTDEAKEAAKEFGLELNTNTLQTIGLVGVLEKLNTATAEQLALIFPEIEGLKGVAAALGDLTGYTEDYKAMLESAGATQEAFTKQTDTLMFHFNQLKEAGKYLAVQLGEIFTPTIGKAIQNLASWVYKLGENIRNLTDKQKQLLAKMTLFGTAVLGAIGALGLFSTVAGVVAAAGSVIMGVLGLILTPIGLLIVAIAALATAWALEWDKIKEITSKLVEIIIIPTMKIVGKKVENLVDLIQEKLGIPKGARKGVWELTAITTTIPFIAELIWKGIKNITGTIKDWVVEMAKLDKPIDELVVKVASFLIELPDPAKWFFKIGTRVWQYASLGIGIWWALKGLLATVKIAPIALPALLPVLVGIGLALVGVDILGKKLKEKLDEIQIAELLTIFSKEHPTLFKLSVAIKELTGLEAGLILAYIDKEWPSIQDKIGLIALQIQIPLKIIFDIDLRTWFGEFWEGFTEDLKDTWKNITWPYLSWQNFTASLKEAWANTDWDWFGIKAAGDILISIGKGFKAIGTTIWDLMLAVWQGSLPAAIEKIKGMVEQLTAPIPVTLEKAAEDFDVDMLYLASIRMCERGGKGVEMGIKVYSQKFKNELKKMYPDIAEGTKEWQILAAAKSTEFYWKEFKKKFGYGADLALKDASKEIKDKFIEYMGKGFAPASAHVLNQYWIPNMKKWFPKLEKLMKEGGHKTVGALIKAIQEKSKKVKLTEFEKALIKYLDVVEKKVSKKGSKVGETIGEAIIKGTSPGGILGGIKYSMPAATREMESQLGKMLNRVQRIADKFGQIFKPALDIMKKMFERVLPYLPKPMQDAIKGLMKTIDDLIDVVGELGPTFKKPFEEGEKAVKKWVAEIEFSTNIAQFISKRYRQQELWYWAKFYNDVLQIEVVSIEDMEKILAGLPPEVKKQLEILLNLWKEKKDPIEEIWEDMLNNIKSSFSSAISDVLIRVKTMDEVFSALAKTIRETIIKALIDVAIQAAITGNAVLAVIAAIGAGLLSLANNVEETVHSSSESFLNAIREMEGPIARIAGSTIAGMRTMAAEIAVEFEAMGMSMSRTLDEAERKLEALHERQVDLQASTREKLISELDKYYDYRKLREMSLDELLALSAETRVKIEQGTIEEVEESEEEQERRRKDREINRLKRIEDNYRKEDELIRRKIALTEIEIKLLEYKIEVEAHGHSARARQLQEELQQMLKNYKESVEAYEDAERRKQAATDETRETVEEANEEMRDSTEVAAEAMEDAMRGTAEAIEDAAEDMSDAIKEATRDMVNAINTMTDEIVQAIRDMAQDIINAINDMVDKINAKLKEIPEEIKFDIFGILHMPEIPVIGSRFFDIIGRYKAPSISTARVGIPYIPRTMPVIVHPKEAILTAPQAEQWRKGGGAVGRAGQGGTQVIYERGAIRMTVMGSINQQVDLEKAMDYLARKQAEIMRRP